MRGRDILKGLSEQPKSEKDETPQLHRAPGAIRAMSLNLNRLNEEAAEGRALREAIASGQTVIELDPAVIEFSFIHDRIEDSSDPSFDALKASMEASGQQVPIMVRPHPDNANAYQVAYGHRRLRAAAALGIPVRAIVRSLSDEELVLAQGQENGDRVDLSFIERALFARRLDEHGFDRDMIGRTLSVDKPELSRLLQVAQTVTPELILAIGPAPKVGRPRWLSLVDRLKDSAARKRALSMIQEAGFTALDSNKRFDTVWKVLDTTHGRKEADQVLQTRKGVLLGAVAQGKAGVKITITSPKFADFLTSRMSRLVAEFESENAEKSSL